MSDIEHAGRHELFFLDGIAASSGARHCQLLEEAIVSQTSTSGIERGLYMALESSDMD